ncbi:MAG: hypothetical protein WEE51_08910 [Pirellulaceae bacterium]
MRRSAYYLLVLFLLGASATMALAEVTTQVVTEGFSQPTAVAIQPETETPFVVDQGAGTIVRVVDGERQEVVTGFEGQLPWALEFVDKNRLVIAGGDDSSDGSLLKMFRLTDEMPSPLAAKEAGEDLTTSPADESSEEESEEEEQSPTEESGPGALTYLAIDRDLVYAAGQATGGGVWRKGITLVETQAEATEEEPARARRDRREESASKKDAERSFQRYLVSDVEGEKSKIAAMITSPRREVTLIETPDGEMASQLVFYDASGKSLLLRLDTGLGGVTALAYSPETGRLYALAQADRDDHSPGLYRLDAVRRDGKQAISPHQVLPLKDGIAMTFSAKGELFLLAGVEAEGKLLKIEPGL